MGNRWMIFQNNRMSALKEPGLTNGLHRNLFYRDTRGGKKLKEYIIRQKLIRTWNL